MNSILSLNAREFRGSVNLYKVRLLDYTLGSDGILTLFGLWECEVISVRRPLDQYESCNLKIDRKYDLHISASKNRIKVRRR